MFDDIFSLSHVTELDDLGATPIGEGSEFAPNSYAKTGAENHIPGKAGTEMGPKPPQNSTQPGETQKKPSGEGEKGPKPPQKTAQPGETTVKSVPHHEMGPKTPQAVELTMDEWNSAVRGLKQSFKEGMELMSMLESCKIVEETTEQKQEKYLQEAMENAYYEALMEGPIFEAVNRKDKHVIKSVVRKVAPKIRSYFKKAGVAYKPIQMYANVKGASWFKKKVWQVLGAAPISNADAKAAADEVNKLVGDKLSGYKVLAVKSWAADINAKLCKKFKWNPKSNIMMFIVDENVPEEFSKEFQLRQSVAPDEKEALTESFFDEDDEEFTEKKSEKCPKCGSKDCDGSCDEECDEDCEDDEDDDDSKSKKSEKSKSKKSKKKKDEDEDEEDDD